MNHEALTLIAKVYISMLKSNNPTQEFSFEKDESDDKYVIAIPYQEFAITDVSCSECGRFESESEADLAEHASYYGITMELAHCLLAVNRYLKTLQ